MTKNTKISGPAKFKMEAVIASLAVCEFAGDDRPVALRRLYRFDSPESMMDTEKPKFTSAQRPDLLPRDPKFDLIASLEAILTVGRPTLRMLAILGVNFIIFAAATQSGFAITEAQVAAIVFHETAGIKVTQFNAHELSTARLEMAKAAFKGNGKGFPPGETAAPKPEELTIPLAKQAWSDSQNAAKYANGSDAGNCDHCVIWPSDDGKVPTSNPAMSASWPYTQKTKINHAWGPFTNKYKTGDTPTGDNIYIFIYCGVP